MLACVRDRYFFIAAEAIEAATSAAILNCAGWLAKKVLLAAMSFFRRPFSLPTVSIMP